VLVKEVKAKKLPPLDDELAKTMGEFDTLDELKNDLRARMAEMKANLVEEQIRSAVLEALLNASHLEPPEKLVAGEFEHRLSHFNEDLQRAGLTMADYEGQAEVTELELRRDIREQAARSVKAELLLEEVARQQGLEVTEDDMGAEIAYLAARSGAEPDQLAQQIAGDPSSVRALASDVLKRKALDYVVGEANVSGRPTDEG
jgi:trigger factor